MSRLNSSWSVPKAVSPIINGTDNRISILRLFISKYSNMSTLLYYHIHEIIALSQRIYFLGLTVSKRNAQVNTKNLNFSKFIIDLSQPRRIARFFTYMVLMIKYLRCLSQYNVSLMIVKNATDMVAFYCVFWHKLNMTLFYFFLLLPLLSICPKLIHTEINWNRKYHIQKWCNGHR